MTQLAIQLLRERLLTGWVPKPDEIDRDVPQIEASDWSWTAGGQSTRCISDGHTLMLSGILFVSADQALALTTDAVLWLK